MNNIYNLSDKDKQQINQWKKTKTSPLFIEGEPGIGKTTLARSLLKDYHIIDINDVTSETIIESIKESINKYDIFMMISQDIRYKSLIIDNIYNLSKINKKNVKKIIDYLLNTHNFKKVPVIIINSTQSNKNIDLIKSKSYSIHLNLSYKLVLQIVNSYLKKKNKPPYNLCQISQIISQYKNIHIINNNLDNLTKTNNSYDIYYNDILKIVNDIFTHKLSFDQMFRAISLDYRTISLNLLDNSRKIVGTHELHKLCELYKYICISDNIDNKYISQYSSLKEINYFYSCIYPIYMKIKTDNIKLTYTNYISTGILQIHNKNSIYISESMNKISIIYYLYLLEQYSITNDEQINQQLKHYSFDTKLLEKQLKLYNYFYNKTINKKKLLSMIKQVE